MRSVGGRRSSRLALVGLLLVAAFASPPTGVAGPAAALAARTLGAASPGAVPAEIARPLPASRGLTLHEVADPAPAVAAPVGAPVGPAADAAAGVRTASSFRSGAPGPVNASSDGLDTTTAASYVVDPAARLVHVDVDLTAVNRLPVTPGVRYYYPGVNLAIQPEAAQIVADEAGTHDKTTTQKRAGYRVLTVLFGTRLYVGQTVHVHLSYVLPAGAPRSSSGVRVGAAYSTFVAWAFGDHGTVEVEVPAPYAITFSGDAMAQGPDAGSLHVFTATATDPGSWYAWIDARNDAALTSQALHLPDGEQVVVRAWPEDPTWQARVAQTLSSGIPALVKRIGLPWPVSGPLSVLEVSGAVLEGYAGFYSPGNQQITISEDLDPLTIVHEASHAWFNTSLFSQRWITEGLADEYAYLTLRGLGVKVDGPPAVKASAAVAFPLDTWGSPAPIKTRTQDAREQWGYDAAWTVVREVVSEVGEPGMAKVFAAALAGTTAYPGLAAGVGSSAPERATLPADWRRFADLAEEIGGGRGIAEMLAPWVLTSAERAQLAPRAAARTAYHQLLAASTGWSAPVVVRMDLDGWAFAAASTAITEARLGIATRDLVRAQAAREDLTVPTGLQAAYEGAATADALTGAVEAERSLGRSLETVATVRSELEQPRDWLVDLGLLGEDPAGALARARTAWQAGDWGTASAEATNAEQELSVAADAGRLRLVAIGATILALVLLLTVGVTMARRRNRGRRRVVAAAATPAASAGVTPQGVDLSTAPTVGEPSASPATPDWIDPSLAPPPPPWGRAGAPSGPPATPGPYPILPPSATAGTAQGSPPHHPDGGAE